MTWWEMKGILWSDDADCKFKIKPFYLRAIPLAAFNKPLPVFQGEEQCKRELLSFFKLFYYRVFSYSQQLSVWFSFSTLGNTAPLVKTAA